MTYSMLQIYRAHILNQRWYYVFLDEGHKIRNPNTDITVTCKRIQVREWQSILTRTTRVTAQHDIIFLPS